MKITTRGTLVRPLGRTIGYSPEAPVGETTDPIDHADTAGWFVPYVSTADIAFIQSKTATNTTTDATITATFDASPTEGNLLIAVIARRELNTDVTLSGWTRYPDADGLAVVDQPGSPNGSNGSVHLFYKIAGAGESASVTIAANGSALKALIIAEFSGGTLFDAASNQSVNSWATSLSTGNLTPTASVAALLVGVILQSESAVLTIGGSFTEIDQSICDTLGPSVIVGYRIVDPTSGAYAMTASSTQNDTYAGMLLSFLADEDTETFLNAPAVNDGSDTTFDYANEASVAAADDVFLVGHLGAAYILASIILRVGLEDAGSTTITVEGADDEDFTSPVTLGSATFTATGSFTAQDVSITVSGDGYPYIRFSLGAAQGVRVYEVEVFGPTDPSTAIDDHVADTTDAHDASAISLLDAADNTAADNVEDAIAELYGLTGIWRPVMAHDGTNWYVVVDGSGTAVMAQG